MSTTTTPERPWLRAVAVIGALVILLWVLEIFDHLTANSLDRFGIVPRRLDSLGSIATAPFLHFGWAHLIANTVPFFVLGVLVYLDGVQRWLTTSLIVILTSGLTVWLLASPGSITAGASGIIFGWLTYVLVRGFFTRHVGQILIAVVILAVYGSVLWGVLPMTTGVSWQAHLGGAAGGVLAAWLLNGKKA
ncbi:MAG TPA: rhomboid family intramembrane serine protease [Arachnia sp.]|nr:rhomboid family intramembrane serine protease [Arachnia sp.]HMT87498.1 rhomboid family intramembrane serine protease [Arachnia sp.]